MDAPCIGPMLIRNSICICVVHTEIKEYRVRIRHVLHAIVDRSCISDALRRLSVSFDMAWHAGRPL